MSSTPSHYSGDEGRDYRSQTPHDFANMSEDELRGHILRLKEAGSATKQMDAYDAYISWKGAGHTVHSAHTVFHAAHAYLLAGASVESADKVAEQMKHCADYSEDMWGDWLADTAMTSASRGKEAEAYNRLNQSGMFLGAAPSHKRLRNRFFGARMNLKHGSNKPYAVQQIWEIREALTELYRLGECDDETLLRNVNWWTMISSARYPQRAVQINGALGSPFATAHLDAINGTELIRETRPRHIKVINLMKRTGPIGRLVISWYVIYKDRT